MLFSNDSLSSDFIKFKNDSILIRTPYYGNTAQGFLSANSDSSIYGNYKYERKSDTIVIFNFNDGRDISLTGSFNDFIENRELKIVYVRRNGFDKNPDVAVKYRDQVFWIDSPETSNGIVIKKGKKNRKLAKLFKNKNPDSLEIMVYRGYEAFEKFGFQYVFGIINVTDKKNGS